MSNRHVKNGKRGIARVKRKRDRQWQETARKIRREQRAGNDQWWPIDGEAESAEPE